MNRPDEPPRGVLPPLRSRTIRGDPDEPPRGVLLLCAPEQLRGDPDEPPLTLDADQAANSSTNVNPIYADVGSWLSDQ